MISQIVGGLAAFAAVGAIAAAYTALERVRRRYYPATPPPYATFEPGPGPISFTPAPRGPHVRLVEVLACHGTCTGRPPHETTGTGTATCVCCGTARPTIEEDQRHVS